MSLRAQIWAWDQKVGSPIAKIILLKLADNTNEETGICFPKHETIAKHCECSRRTVIRNIKKLEEMNILTVISQHREGKQIQNKYRLNLQNEVNLGVTESHTRCDSHDTLGVTESHTESVSLTSKSIKEKSIKKKNLTMEKKPAWLPQKTLDDFIEHRRQIKKPITQIGLERLLTKLAEIRTQGGNPEEAINNSILSGYQGVFANKFKNKIAQGESDEINSKNYSKGATKIEDMPEFIQDAITEGTEPDRPE